MKIMTFVTGICRCRLFALILIAVLVQGLHGQITTGFTNGYEIESWTKTGITDGTTEMIGLVSNNETPSAEFKYTVRKTGGGVSNRVANYTVTVPESANISFDWIFSGNHRWFQAFVEFQVIVNGVEVANVVDTIKTSGAFNLSGVNQSVSVEAGDTFGFRIGGQNFDSTSALDGLLNISNFRVEETAAPALNLAISANSGTPGTFDFEWASRTGRVYELLSSTDLSIPIEDWAVWDNRADIPPALGELTQITAVAPDGPRRFFVVVERRIP